MRKVDFKYSYLLAIAALFLVHIIWGATPVIVKLSVREIPPMSLAFLRFMLASVLLLPFLWVIRKQIFKPQKSNRAKQHKSRIRLNIKLSDLPWLMATGVFIVSFHIFLFFEGLVRTNAINASVLSLMAPMISVIAGWWFLKEKIYLVNLAGIGLGLIGALVITGLPLLIIGSISEMEIIGNLLIILSSICFVIGAGLSKRMLQVYPTLLVIEIAFMVGAASFLPLALIEWWQNLGWWQSVTIMGVIGVILTTVLSSISAYFLYEWGIKRIGIVRADIIQYIQPAVAATLAVWLLGERISFSFIIGCCLIVIGVYWGTLGKNEHHHHSLRHHRV